MKILSEDRSMDASLTVNALAGRLACPLCGGPLAPDFICEACSSSYQPNGGVLDLRPPEIRGRAEERDWSKHWPDEFQKSNRQRFSASIERPYSLALCVIFSTATFPERVSLSKPARVRRRLPCWSPNMTASVR